VPGGERLLECGDLRTLREPTALQRFAHGHPLFLPRRRQRDLHGTAIYYCHFVISENPKAKLVIDA
jgi:hypothetical protein